MSQGVVTMSAPDECSESDPLVWTPAESEWHEDEQNRSHSSVVQDDVDIQLQPPVRMGGGEAEIILPEVGTVLAPDDCLESDLLEMNCKEQDLLGRAPQLSPRFMGCPATGVNKARDAHGAGLVRPRGETGKAPPAGPSSSEAGITLRSPHRVFMRLEQDRLGRDVMKRPDHIDKDGKHKCDWCQYSTNYAFNLASHRMIHTGEQPHRCNVCGTTFNQLDNLRRHQVRLHAGQRPFQCDMCEQAYSRRRNLKRHWLTHSGGRPYRCDVCHKTFSHSNHLTSHHRAVHTGLRLY